MTKAIILNNTCVIEWMMSTRGLPFEPSASNPKANITEKNNTGMTSPSAKAPTALDRHQVQQELAEGDRFCGRLYADIGDGLQIHVHAGAGRPEVHQNQGKDQSDRRHHFKINQRFNRNAADLFRFADARDAVHHRAENDRRHQHSHEFNEQVAKRLPRIGVRGPHAADEYAQHHRNQDLDGEMFVPGTRARGRGALVAFCYHRLRGWRLHGGHLVQRARDIVK